MEQYDKAQLRPVKATKRSVPWKGIGFFVMGIVFAIGLVTIFSNAKALFPASKKAPTKSTAPAAASGTSAGTKLAALSAANFAYIMPASSGNWLVISEGQAFDPVKSVAKYVVELIPSNVHITVSQQAMPSALMPRGSEAFVNFINASKVSRSQDVGNGTLYFLPALSNGAVANGADTVIFATDNILLFGRAESVVGYDAWVSLIQTMK